MSRQERAAIRQKIAARRANKAIEEAYEKAKAESLADTSKLAQVAAARRVPASHVDPSGAQAHVEKVMGHPRTLPSPQDQAAEVKRLRDSGEAWWVIGQKLGLAGKATSASQPEAKRGAGAARRLYASVNSGEVPRSHAQRKGTVAKPTGPASRGVPAYLRKERLVRDGHVIPRDMPDEEVEAMLVGRRIEWAIDMARLTSTDPATWGPEDGRWVKQEARVHRESQWVKVVWEETDDGEERRVYFREDGGRDTNGRIMSGPTRCVRVDAIYTVA
jgi:hypothetical protein